MTEAERLAFNAKMKDDRENGYITVKWTEGGEPGAGFSSWCWGHEQGLNPDKYSWIWLQEFKEAHPTDQYDNPLRDALKHNQELVRCLDIEIKKNAKLESLLQIAKEDAAGEGL